MTRFWKAGLAGAVLALAGCEYFDATKGVEPPPAQGRPFPNLASVPSPPPKGPTSERQTEVGQLTADRDATVRQDQQIRALNPGSALPPPRARTGQAAQPGPSEAPPATGTTPAPETAPPAPDSRSAAVTRPLLPSSLFMGTVVPAEQRGTLSDFQRKVLQDSAAMAQRSNGRIRLVGGRTAEDRQRVAGELVALGMAAGRISAVPDSTDANRVGIDVLVEN